MCHLLILLNLCFCMRFDLRRCALDESIVDNSRFVFRAYNRFTPVDAFAVIVDNEIILSSARLFIEWSSCIDSKPYLISPYAVDREFVNRFDLLRWRCVLHRMNFDFYAQFTQTIAYFIVVLSVSDTILLFAHVRFRWFCPRFMLIFGSRICSEDLMRYLIGRLHFWICNEIKVLPAIMHAVWSILCLISNLTCSPVLIVYLLCI